MNENTFTEMSLNEMQYVDGGKSNVVRFAQAFAGVIMVGTTPVVGVAAGIVGGPIAGGAAAASYGGLGISLIGASAH